MGRADNRSLQMTDSCFKACLRVMQIMQGARRGALAVSSLPYCAGRKLAVLLDVNGSSHMKRMRPMRMPSVRGRHTWVLDTVRTPMIPFFSADLTPSVKHYCCHFAILFESDYISTI